MEIHNIFEDIVFDTVKKIFGSITKEGNPKGLCLCDQCRLDTICYTLNRVVPRYIVSNRGMARTELDWTGRQQTEADIATLVYKGLQLINHNKRPTTTHDKASSEDKILVEPAFHMPTIIGRVFSGETFAPLAGITVSLLSNGELVPMRNHNWQNPFSLVANTPGTFTFWPAPVPAESINVHRMFEYSLKIESPQYETLTHFFKIPAVSTILASQTSGSMDRTFKLDDLYLFLPGDAEQNG